MNYDEHTLPNLIKRLEKTVGDLEAYTKQTNNPFIASKFKERQKVNKGIPITVVEKQSGKTKHFNSIKEASKYLNCSPSSVRDASSSDKPFLHKFFIIRDSLVSVRGTRYEVASNNSKRTKIVFGLQDLSAYTGLSRYKLAKFMPTGFYKDNHYTIQQLKDSVSLPE